MAQQPIIDPTTFDLREDKTSKGEGFFGSLLRPDGGGVMSEYSVGVPINGKEMDIPTFVPTLTAEEVTLLLNLPEGKQPPQSIIQKAAQFAQQRVAAGKPVFAEHGEQQEQMYPQFKRAKVQMPKVLSRTGQSRTPEMEQLLLERLTKGQQ